MKRWRRGVSVQEMPALAWRIQQELERLPEINRRTVYDEIGTLYQFFGRPEADEWFRKAIDGYRAGVQPGADRRASIKAAIVLWKAGDKEECEAECLELLKTYGATPQAGTSTEDDQKAVIALGQTLMASFLLGRYREAIAVADRILALCERVAARQGYPAHDVMAMAVREMSAGILEQDRLGFERGLDRLAAGIDRWPTPASSLLEDFFRYGLSLPICNAEAFIRWKMEGDDGGIQ